MKISQRKFHKPQSQVIKNHIHQSQVMKTHNLRIMVRHSQLKSISEITLQQPLIINDTCRDKQNLINDNGSNICKSCGAVNDYQIAKE